MPHLKVAPFDTKVLDTLVSKDSSYLFYGKDESHNNIEVLGVEYEGTPFVLEIKKRDRDYLVRSDKISRPLDVNIIKKALDKLAKDANLNILHSNIEYSSTKPPLAQEYEKSILDFENIEFDFEKVSLEVGFGSGRHLLWQARQNPDTLFIGVEIHTPSAQQVLRQIYLNKIENIWILNYDARLLMEMLPSNRLQSIFVHFPVPWDKKPHRRVIRPEFIEEALRVLKPNGFLELRTDSENYYRYSLEVFSEPLKVDFYVEKNKELPVVSKYEARWRRMEKNIYTMTLYSKEESPERKLDIDFSFKGEIDIDKLSNLPKKSILKDGYFIHFSHHYNFSNNGALIEVSFGSFDRPEHKYLLYKSGKIEYFPHRPVATRTNMKAHRDIMEIFNV